MIDMDARKGDLILIERKEIISSLTEARRERVTYEFGMVGSATRAGVVTSWRMLQWGEGIVSDIAVVLPRHSRLWVMPKKGIDVLGALAAAKAHHWEGHPNQPKPFDTFEDAREAVRHCVVKKVAA